MESINEYDADVSSCKIPVIILIKLVFLSGKQIIAFVFLLSSNNFLGKTICK